MSTATQVDHAPMQVFVVDQNAQIEELKKFPRGVQMNFWSEPPEPDDEFLRQFGRIHTTFIKVSLSGHELLLPITYDDKDRVLDLEIPGWSQDTNTAKELLSKALLPEAQNLSVDFCERLSVAVRICKLPPLVASIVCSNPDLSIDDMVAQYSPSPDQFYHHTTFATASGISCSGKSIFYTAMEKYGHCQVVGFEPHDAWGVNNYRKIIETSYPNSIPDEKELINMIKSNMPYYVESGDARPDQDLFSAFAEIVAKFETGKVRPDIIIFDLPGLSPENPRDPQLTDLLYFFSGLTRTFVGREVVDNKNRPVSRHDVDFDINVFHNYWEDWQEVMPIAQKDSYNNQGFWFNRLEDYLPEKYHHPPYTLPQPSIIK
ncbi:hypothetical protein KBC75_01745 [Candidatus Shapirobacteria bacterium]|nr:hypothetical protein [Candidatus Shapirobacteria bacterium]